MSTQPVQSRGASSSHTSYGAIISAWRKHHVTSASGAFKRLLATPVQTLMTTLVAAIALALPATLWLCLGNIERLGDQWDTQPKLSAFLHLRAQPAAIKQLQTKVGQMAEVAEVEYLSPAQALASFEQQSGLEDVLAGLEDNPLPPTFIITPSNLALNPAQLHGLAERIRQERIVESVALDMDWVRRLRAMMDLGQQVVLALAGLLGLGALLAIGNTIRLAIESRKEEIIVTKLVGGTNGFVRRPFLYCGLWYGLIGAILACILVTAGFISLSGTVATLANTYATTFALQGLTAGSTLIILGAGTLLGWLGAWLAVGRHLHQIEPR